MFVSSAVIIGLFSINFAWSLRNCEDDCVAIHDCLEAKEYLLRRTPDAQRVLRESVCRIANNGINICCRDFKMAITTPAPEVQEHPNMKLLPDDCGEIKNQRLIYRQVASMYEFPWMALISYDTGKSIFFGCSGTLINSRYILTAAHCVEGSTKVAGVRIGEYDMRFSLDCQNNVCENNIQDRRVVETIVHSKFRRYPKYENDIALLRLHPSIDLNLKNAGTICLPVTQELRNSTIENKIGTVTGWGVNEFNSDPSVLFKVNAPILSMNDCRELKSQMSDPNNTQFCAGQFGRNSCKGDDGGPLIIEDTYKNSLKYVQFGILSLSPQQCGSETPGIYTDIRKYVDWILDNIRE